MIFKLNSEGFILDWDRATIEEKDEIIKDVLNFSGVKTFDIWRNSVDEIIKNILHL